MLEQNDDQDVFVRHGGVMALSGAARKNPSLLKNVLHHPSTSVRRAVVVALRKLNAPEVAMFLGDIDPLVVSEAARAIHDDLSIPEALPALGRLLARPAFDDEASIRRAINTNLRLGSAEAAYLLAEYAANKKRLLKNFELKR